MRNKINPFLKRLVTGDEKWITYDNVNRKRSWSNRGKPVETVVKPELMTRKVLLCVQWDYQGIIYYELLSYGKTLNSEVYCQQLDRLKETSSSPRSGLLYYLQNGNKLSNKTAIFDLNRIFLTMVIKTFNSCKNNGFLFPTLLCRILFILLYDIILLYLYMKEKSQFILKNFSLYFFQSVVRKS